MAVVASPVYVIEPEMTEALSPVAYPVTVELKLGLEIRILPVP
jgi:hypothetical protein